MNRYNNHCMCIFDQQRHLSLLQPIQPDPVTMQWTLVIFSISISTVRVQSMNHGPMKTAGRLATCATRVCL